MNKSKAITKSDAITLAKAGDPKLIADFLNYKLKPQGISARVTKKQSHLLVLLEKENSPPDEEKMVALLQQIAKKLNPKTIKEIRGCGRIKGEEIPSWLQPIKVGESKLFQAPLKEWLESVRITPSLFYSDHENEREIKEGQRFLRFHLGEEDSALLAVNTVKEVLSVSGEKILPVPDVPSSVLGLHNWRGEMLWVIDLNDLLGFLPLWEIENITTKINIIVLQVENQEIGIAVRQVETIEKHDWQKLQAPEGLFPPHLLSYVQGYLTEANSIILNAQALVQAFSG